MGREGKITIKDIAEMAGVSKTTVSFFLNGKTEKMSPETRDKIQDIIRETNYRPNIAARTLNQKKTHLIGVIIGDITNTFSNRIVKGIEDTARKRGYQTLIGNSAYDPEMESSYVSRMLTLGADGFIIQPTPGFRETSGMIKAENKPFVYFDSKIYEEDASWVKTDNYQATYRAIDSLIHKGYSNFLMIGADPSRLSTRIERSSGFIDCVTENGFSYRSLLIKEGEIDNAEVVRFVEDNMKPGHPTLVYVPNCWALPEIHKALQQFKDKVPDQLGIIGFDNVEWAVFSYPKITTIVQPAYEEGQKAAEMLIDQIEETNKEKIHQTLKCSVNWTESTM
ncbi:LacI family DNA-binding transcriptional regulator [Oribacterium sp. WCC10]|uniref:LacI family DNA-binding transcriptional regulator n=1 Tax=Oribacterium sp. WCC10 TaxID=1855343 RepID=UPI0008DEDCCD|nr:LacI family DNA-binding transcriptional regulator [Oribacterium sp. WCC10]SFG61879.1 DNA-binding transcriptional regulator, LacI/PurR family [Oribacterium sp. WCC10]